MYVIQISVPMCIRRERVIALWSKLLPSECIWHSGSAGATKLPKELVDTGIFGVKYKMLIPIRDPINVSSCEHSL